MQNQPTTPAGNPAGMGPMGPRTVPKPVVGTVPQQHQPMGFPPFKTESYPAQFFWLGITFTILLVVMWRIAVPRIGGSIGLRRSTIDGDLAAAEAHREAAQKASADYEAALAAARARAHAMAEENHKRIQAEIDGAKAKAESEAQAAMGQAEQRIGAMREQATGHVRNAARDAARDIVARLIGEPVSAEEADAALNGAG